MFRTLYAKLAGVLVLLMVLVGLVYMLVSWSATRHYLQEINQRLNRDLARNLVADRNLVEEGRINQEALKETFHQYMVINPSIEIYLLDLDGGILAYSADPEKVKRRRVALAPIRAFLAGDRFPLGDDPRSHDARKPFSVTPVPTAERPEGYLYVVLRGEEFDEVERAVRESHFLRLSGWALAAGLAFGLLAGLLLFHLLTRRLRVLATAMEDFRVQHLAGQDLATSREEPSDGTDEIDRLSRTFQAMADRIGEQLEALERKDALRREMVAQVSHDLRTPLASLRGYLETLTLKAESLPESERDEYLRAALGQSEALSRLVDALFELAKLDACDAPPRREPFNLAELVQDVVQKYQPGGREKGVEIRFHPESETAWVNADIALMERVFDNLIENALQHTPGGGRVVITLSEDQRGLHARVSDTGRGIAADELPRVFDRFYRGSRGGGTGGHSGLGLAIVKRILELHGAEVQVESPPGGGTTIHFVLPAQE
ncbi:MAG: ATP-binding protein [Gammaproteobacteria bacterium]